jgi:hypothetical protein
LTFFRHTFFKQPPKLQQQTVSGKRHYVTPNGNKLPSVTTVLSLLSKVGIDAWKRRVGEAEAKIVSERAIANGNELHLICENYLDNKPITQFKNETSLKLFEQMKEELHRINNIKAQEVQLYSEGMGVAGRVDCIAEYDGVLSVIDFKSARKKKTKSMIKSYFLQATAYSEMYKELTGEEIKQIVVMISAEDGVVKSFIENPDDYKDHLHMVIEDYQLRKEFDNVENN